MSTCSPEAPSSSTGEGSAGRIHAPSLVPRDHEHGEWLSRLPLPSPPLHFSSLIESRHYASALRGDAGGDSGNWGRGRGASRSRADATSISPAAPRRARARRLASRSSCANCAQLRSQASPRLRSQPGGLGVWAGRRWGRTRAIPTACHCVQCSTQRRGARRCRGAPIELEGRAVALSSGPGVIRARAERA